MSTPFWPRLDPDSGLPSWVRADLKAMPDWAGKNDLRTRRPITAVRKVPSRSAEREGAAVTPNRRADRGRTVLVAAVAVVLLVVWRRL